MKTTTNSMLATLLFAVATLAGSCSSSNNGSPVNPPTPDPGDNDKPTKPETLYYNPVIKQSLPDPTVIRTGDGTFYLYATEDTHNTPIYKSKDLVNWDFVGTCFTDGTRPKFVQNGGIWAPDINYINGKYVLYFSMSTWGGEWECGIGRAVADKPEGPFTDADKLFLSREIGVQNSIDQFYIEDGGKKYIFWGSFHGIYGAELSDDGLSLKDGLKTPKTKVAGDFMEGTYIYKHGKYYYLIGSNGSCCEGDNSTYRLVYGRSENLFGPYVTKNGERMLDGKYEVLLHGNSKVAGPGHNAEINTDDEGNDWIIYHGYVKGKSGDGRQTFLDQVLWTEDGWPYIENDTPSFYHKKPVFNEEEGK